MEEHFANYNQALALKELGFDEPCIARYIIPGDLVFKGCYEDSNIIHLELTQNDICEAHVLAPLKSQVFKWFRDEHNINHVIDKHRKFGFCIQLWNNLTCLGEFDEIKTYEEAESACIDKLIELIKKK
jgi:hypothetical protein